MLVADQQLADDAAQEVMLAAIQAPPRHAANVRGWLGVAVRRAVSRLRTPARRESSGSPEADQTPDPAADSPLESATSLEMHRDLVQAVLALEQPYREAIRLRYLEDLSLDDVAARTGVLRNTVRSHLTRGLAQLRSRLDARHGGRGAWLALVAPLARRKLAADAASTALTVPTTSVAIAMTMKKVLVAVVAVLVCAVVGLRSWVDPLPTSQQSADGGNARAATAASEQAAALRSKLLDKPAVPIVPERTVAAIDDPRPVRGAGRDQKVVPAMRLVDAYFRALPGLRMRRAAPNAVRWQGGDAGWISGPSESLRLSPAKLALLRVGGAAAEKFFGARKHAKQWRATVLGEPLPKQEVATTEAGEFSFAPETVEVAAVELVEAGWTLLSRPADCTEPFVGCPAVALAGRILAANGSGIAGATIAIDTQRALPKSMQADLARVRFLPVRAGNDGGYVLRTVPHSDGVLLRARAAGYADAVVPVPSRSLAAMDITLWPLDAGEQGIVDGVVVDQDGAPIPGAEVIAGRTAKRTGDDGTFQLTMAATETSASLTVVAAGRQPWHRPGFGQRLADDANAGRRLRITLGAAARTLRARVVEPGGRPAAGYGCNLVDPTLLGYSFTSVEARSGSRARSVKTDAEGRLVLSGLSDRSYFLRIWNAKTGYVHVEGPLQPVGDELLVQLPAAAKTRRLEGRCVAQDGSAVVGAKLRITWCTYVTRSGGTMWEDLDAGVRSDADGRFVLDAVPSGGEGVLMAEDAQGNRVAVPLASMQSGAELVTVTFGAQVRWLKLLPDSSGPSLPVVAVGADGRVRSLTAWIDGQPQLGEFLIPVLPTLVRLDRETVALRIAPNTARERRVDLDLETTHVHIR